MLLNRAVQSSARGAIAVGLSKTQATRQWPSNGFNDSDARALLDQWLALVEASPVNLTGAKTKEAMERELVADSLAFVEKCEAHLSNGSSVIDVGSGAGAPGIPLAISRQDIHVTLNDSQRKKCDFLQHAVDELRLVNCEVAHGRAEELGHGALRERYDVAVARALADMRVLSELCLPLVRVGGCVVGAKGARVEEEVDASSEAIRACGGRSAGIETVDSQDSSGESRTVVIVPKSSSTPPSYPRRPGTPAKRPL